MAEYDLNDKRVAILATDYFEQDELIKPLEALRIAGAEVDVIAPHGGELPSLVHVDPGQSVAVDLTFEEANAAEYDAVVVPGGVVNADHLRMEEEARRFVQAIYEVGKPTAVICHSPWLLVSAELVRGKQLTSYYTIQDDIRNAGGRWLDQPVVIDGNLITSRQPDDLPAFIDALMQRLATAPATTR